MLRLQNGWPINVRHSSVCRLVEKLQPPRQTKLCRTSTQTIALLIFMAAFVFPIYGQEVTKSDRAQPEQITTEQTAQDLEPSHPNLPEAAETSSQAKSGQTGATTSKPFVFPTRRERFNRYLKSTVGPFSLLHTGISAGINQWRDNPEEWEQGASGYGKRFASGFGRTAIQQTVIYGLDSALGLDTGFKKSQRKGFFPRMKDALAENITSRTRTGKRVISVPRISGVYASRIISAEAWYPASYDYKDGLRSGTRSLLTGFGMNLIREFIINF
jgi:hypothetical protein